MKSARLLKIVNPLLLLAVLVQATTGLLMLLSGSKAAIDVHIVSGLSLLVLTGVHVKLNWAWVRGAYFRRKS